MLVKIITLVFSDSLSGFDDTPLRDFMARHQVYKIKPEFFMKDGIPHWSVLLSYDLFDKDQCDGSQADKADSKNSRTNWKNEVSEEKWNLFNELRDWRNETGRNAGIPPYLVLTNRQLIDVISLKSHTLAALGEIDGVGPARIKKYGKELLMLLKGSIDSGNNTLNKAGTLDEENPGSRGDNVLDRVSRLVDDDDRQFPEEKSSDSCEQN